MKKNHWFPLEGYPEVWVGQYVVPNFISNSVLIKVSDRELVIVSPGASLLPALDQLLEPGVDKSEIHLHVVMPNAYHFMGVETWQSAFSNHALYASEKAIPKLLSKGVASKGEAIIPLEDRKLLLPPGYDVLLPPGHRAGDAWLVKQGSEGVLWVTCDSFLNYDRVSNQPIARFMQKLLGAAPGLKMSQVVKWFIIDDRKDFKSWLFRQLDDTPPTTLVPSHGEVVNSPELGASLRTLVECRL